MFWYDWREYVTVVCGASVLVGVSVAFLMHVLNLHDFITVCTLFNSGVLV